MQKWANDESAKQPDWPFKLDAALLLDSVHITITVPY